jgi:Mg-chelatase subunit ChlD
LAVSIDKRPAQVTSVRPAKDDTLLFVLLVDVSTSEAPRAQAVKDAAVQIFESLTTGGNQGYLVLVNQLVMPSKRPLRTPEAQATLDQIRFAGGTALYDGIAQSCTRLLAASQNPGVPRRVLVLLSDGDDNYSHVTFLKTEEAAEREGVAIFSLAEITPSVAGEAYLKQISRDTGGREILVDRLSDGVAQLLAAVQGQEVISIVPSQAADQKLHSLAVKTTEKDLSVSVQAHILLP